MLTKRNFYFGVRTYLDNIILAYGVHLFQSLLQHSVGVFQKGLE